MIINTAKIEKAKKYRNIACVSIALLHLFIDWQDGKIDSEKLKGGITEKVFGIVILLYEINIGGACSPEDAKLIRRGSG